MTVNNSLAKRDQSMKLSVYLQNDAVKKLSKKMLAVIGAAAFVGAILAVILIARTPMPL